MCIQQPANQRGPAPFGLKKASVLSLSSVEEFVGAQIPLALIALYWLVEVSK